MTPKRVQRKRTKGWQNPGAIYIGRGSIFGNPFVIGDRHPALPRPMTREDVVELYSLWIDERIDVEYIGVDTPDRDAHLVAFRIAMGWEMVKRGWAVAQAARALLAGKTLMCWCGVDEPCHGDPLLEVANKAVPA